MAAKCRCGEGLQQRGGGEGVGALPNVNIRPACRRGEQASRGAEGDIRSRASGSMGRTWSFLCVWAPGEGTPARVLRAYTSSRSGSFGVRLGILGRCVAQAIWEVET